MSPGSCETPTQCKGFYAFTEQPNFLELHSHGRACQGSEYSNSQSPQLGKRGCQPSFSSQGHPTLMSSLGLEIKCLKVKDMCPPTIDPQKEFPDYLPTLPLTYRWKSRSYQNSNNLNASHMSYTQCLGEAFPEGITATTS